ncbi:hypothetical protein EZ428_23065 [Pedobacter frigiditerrae]|uniref:Uncharacterized protein n=1 Tax=Pedobacter frigiditerrae TaxID=2530452 RepID=A0A4R0MKG5_9SPHI|nr:hypothetical protein [Pedobacter frigiditerrae]TCC87080.1 hypothetical protein EZ428_23065 [Pedobacter frigiditerrae]
MLQNRVNPFGDIIATKARGQWLGNRGQLHGAGKTILRPFKHKAWIICLLEFKDRHRVIMSPNLWTELFFLDEATAMAAGHRPCFECRREAANLFKAAWLRGNPEYGFNQKTLIGKIDEVLQKERINESGQKVTFEATLQELPDGTFIEMDNQAYLVSNEMVYLWSPFGYAASEQIPPLTKVKVLTPRSMVNAIKAGYPVQYNSVTT